jgi:hypothetical protein
LSEKEIASSLEFILSIVEGAPRNDSSRPLFRQALILVFIFFSLEPMKFSALPLDLAVLLLDLFLLPGRPILLALD